MQHYSDHIAGSGSASDLDDDDDIAERVRRDFDDLSHRSRLEAQRIGQTIQAELGRVLQGRQDAAADVMRDIAATLRENRTGNGNGRDRFDHLEATIADALDRSASGIQEFDLRDVGQRIDHVVREQPLAAAVGAAAIGLLVSRFLKSSHR